MTSKLYKFSLLLIVCLCFSCSNDNETKNPTKYTYFADGKTVKESIEHNQAGQIHGDYTLYDSLGTVIEYGQYVNDTLDGIQQFFYPSGVMEIEANFVKGKYHGDYINYFEKGQLKSKGQFENGILSGEWTYYYSEPKNTIKEVVHFENNEENGAFKEYHTNGTLTAEGSYLNGSEDGLLTEYDSSGTKTKEILFVNERMKSYKEFLANGEVVEKEY